MKVLLACYHTSALREAIEANGHSVTSCDLKESLSPGKHYQGDVRDLLQHQWDFVFGFPPCTYLAKVQTWRCQRDPSRAALRLEAARFACMLFTANAKQIAIENPVGYLTEYWRPPNQIVRPWWFGDPYRKEICLWTKNLPPLMASLYNPIRKSVSNHVNGRMSQDLKSEIKSSWNWYPLTCEAIAYQWFPRQVPSLVYPIVPLLTG